MSKKNMHGDHVASCYCCDHFVMIYDHDYSDITPGEGFQMQCAKWHWSYSESDFHYLTNARERRLLIGFHEHLRMAETCADFEGREG